MFDDKILVKNIALGDMDSFSFLIEKYKYKVSYFVFKVTADKDACEAISKDIFIQTYQDLDSYDIDTSFSQWLFGITKKKIISYFESTGKPNALFYEISVLDFPDTFDNTFVSDNFAKEVVSIINPKISPIIQNIEEKFDESQKSPENIVPPVEINEDANNCEQKNVQTKKKKEKMSHPFAFTIILTILLICLASEIYIIRELEASNSEPPTANNAPVKQDTTIKITGNEFYTLRLDYISGTNSENERVLYIYDPVNSKKAYTLNFDAVKDVSNTNFMLIKDKIYFYSTKDTSVKCMDLKGNVQVLYFTKNENSLPFDFIVSFDNQKIAWTKALKISNSKINYAIYAADIDGSNQKKILSIDYDSFGSLGFLKWAQDNNTIYYGKRFEGIGGNGIMEKLENLYKVNISTGEKQFVMSKDRKYNNSEYISAMSRDDSMIAYFDKMLYIKNASNKVDEPYDLPIDNYISLGKSVFSPDNKYLYYEVNIKNNDSHITKYVIVNLNNNTSKLIDFK